MWKLYLAIAIKFVQIGVDFEFFLGLNLNFELLNKISNFATLSNGYFSFAALQGWSLLNFDFIHSEAWGNKLSVAATKIVPNLARHHLQRMTGGQYFSIESQLTSTEIGSLSFAARERPNQGFRDIPLRERGAVVYCTHAEGADRNLAARDG